MTKDLALNALEAQLWLNDEAFARWAIAEHGLEDEALEAARAKADAMSLFEILINENQVPAAEAEEVLRSDPLPLKCEGCQAEFNLPGGLASQVIESIPCPICKGAVVEGTGEVDPNELPATRPYEAFPKLGNYQLIHRLGEGGMGSVYLAERPEGGQVALKMLTAPASDEEARRRFAREAQILERLEHPNIVQALDHGVDEESGRPYLALELVRGWDLRAILHRRDDGKLTPPETVLVLDHCAQALAYAHGKGVIHRDVNPGNILATPEGSVKLSDFGLALSQDVSVRLTAHDEVLGTPSFISPEALTGGDWEPAADMYSLGAVGFSLLTGRPPFEGTVKDVLEAAVKGEAPRVDSLEPDVPPALVRLVAELLEKDPLQRPSALELRDRLADLIPPEDQVVRLWADASDDEQTQPVSPMASLVQEALQPQQVFHHFKIEEELGRGGMGVVYRAKHMGLKKTVALKVLLAGTLATDEERRRFLREAESAGALQHPNIVPILDAGEHKGTYFLTMSHVKGKPLNEYMQDVREPEQLLRMFTRVCEGVAHAHSRGVIHRDLKPDNILVDEGGTPRILDFGIAKKIDQEASDSSQRKKALTTEGDILGTLKYMPPEQAAGHVQDVDVRSDVYALGSILYELVCGETPFKGNLRELLHQIHFAHPRPPSVNRPGVPWELDAICLKSLEKEQDDRYQSALELRQDVEFFLEGKPIRARRATPWYRLKKWTQRNRRLATSIAGTVLLVCALLGGWIYTVIQTQQEHQEQLLAATGQAWQHFADQNFQAAHQGFGAAAALAKAGDNFPLPSDVFELIPQELRTSDSGEWVNADRLAKWERWANERKQRREVDLLVREAQQAFRQSRFNEAGQSLQLAARRAPNSGVIKTLTARVYQGFMERGDRWLVSSRGSSRTSDERRDQLEQARESYEQAQRLDKSRREAVTKLVEVAGELGKLAELEQAAALLKKDRYQARKHTESGHSLMKAGKLQEARRAFERALAFDATSPQARKGLLAAERAIDQARRAQARRQLQTRVDQLVAEGKAFVAQDDLERARVKFIQALAFDGSSKAAREGLVDAIKRSNAVKAKLEAKRRMRMAQGYVGRGLKVLEEGRALFRAGSAPNKIRERYFECMEMLQRALLVVRNHPPAKKLLKQVGREFALILVEQGYPELSEFILRIGGVDPNSLHNAELPLDKHLAVVDADRISLRRAYGTIVRFLPTKVFDDLRKWIKARGDRYRIRIAVRSSVTTKGLYPKVYVTGLWIYMDDTYKLTKQTLGKVMFRGGPYRRHIQVNSHGHRIVSPFERSNKFRAAPYVKQVERIVKTAIING